MSEKSYISSFQLGSKLVRAVLSIRRNYTIRFIVATIPEVL